MPSVTVEIPETYSAITRPVIVEVAKDLIKKIGLPNNTSLTYLGSSESAIQPGSALTKPEENNFFSQGSNITLEASEMYLEDRVLTTAVSRVENKAFFRDTPLRITMAPVYVGTEVTLSLRLRAKDRTTAEKWKDQLRLRTSQGRGELLHTLNYHYQIPNSFLIILSELHTLRENIAGYGDSVYEWLQQSLSNKTTKLVTQAGSQPILTVGEEQVGVLGWFEFMASPETSQKSNEGGAYEIGFDYKFVYDKVIAVNFKYPLVIHNQYVPDRFRPTEAIYQLNSHHMEPSWSRLQFNKFTGLYNSNKKTGLGGVSIPYFDEWVPKYVQPNTSTIYTTVLGVDTDQPKYLLNLTDLELYQFDPAVIRFLKGEAPYLQLTNQSVFHVSMFSWEYPLPENTITVNEELEAFANFDLNLRHFYHFRFAIVNDLTVLSKDAIERLRNDPEAAFELIKILHPDFANTCSVAFYTRLGLAPETTLNDIFDDLHSLVDPKTTLADLFCSNLMNDSFFNNRDLYDELKKLINLLLIAKGLLPKPVANKLIKQKDMNDIINVISKNVVTNASTIEKHLRTVGQYVIIARSKEE